ncbi:HTH_Tnp_Tc3_2 domain-containing protein [Trichonephila clavipes]|nr:HTH_Tnp_Tc3_2 domain-containing protein [Trichonephila clavipes]
MQEETTDRRGRPHQPRCTTVRDDKGIVRMAKDGQPHHQPEHNRYPHELGITQSVIFRLWQRFQDDGNVSRCYSTGRSRVTTTNEDRYLAVTAKRNRRSTASDLFRQLSSATGTTVSRQTVYRRLGFSLQSDSRRTLIWGAPGYRYHQENTIERHRSGGSVWLVWGGIILGSRTDLHVQRVTMTGHIYRDVILEQHVRLFRVPWVLNFGLWMTTSVLTFQAL